MHVPRHAALQLLKLVQHRQHGLEQERDDLGGRLGPEGLDGLHDGAVEAGERETRRLHLMQHGVHGDRRLVPSLLAAFLEVGHRTGHTLQAMGVAWGRKLEDGHQHGVNIGVEQLAADFFVVQHRLDGLSQEHSVLRIQVVLPQMADLHRSPVASGVRACVRLRSLALSLLAGHQTSALGGEPSERRGDGFRTQRHEARQR